MLHPEPCVALALLAITIVGCEDPGPPRHNVDDFMARRRMVRTLVNKADRAEEHGDLDKALAGYTLATELWPDFPEAQSGGAWAQHTRRLRNEQRTRQHLDQARARAEALRARLNASARELDQMSHALEGVINTPTSLVSSWRGLAKVLLGGVVGLRRGARTP